MTDRAEKESADAPTTAQRDKRGLVVALVVAGLVLVAAAVAGFLLADRVALGRAISVAFLVVAIGDAIVLVLELREHRRLTRKAGIELLVAAALLYMAIGDSRKENMDRARDNTLLADNARLEEQMSTFEAAHAQRTLTPEQASAITTALRASPGHVLKVYLPSNQPEVERYKSQLVDAITAGGWTVPHPIYGFSDHNPPGLFLLVHDGEHPPDAANVLYAALNAANLKVTGSVENKLNPDEIELVVSYAPSK